MDLFGFEEELDLQNTNVVPCDSAPIAIPQKFPTRDRSESLSISQIQDILRNELEAKQKVGGESVTISADESASAEYTEQSIIDSTLFEEPAGIDEISLRPRAQPKRQAADNVKYREYTRDDETDSTIKSTRNPKKKFQTKKKNVQPQQRNRIRRRNAENDDTNNNCNDENDNPNIMPPAKTIKKGLQARNENVIPIANTYSARKNSKVAERSVADIDANTGKRKRNNKKKKEVMLEENEDVQHKMEEINSQFKAVEEYQLTVEK